MGALGECTVVPTGPGLPWRDMRGCRQGLWPLTGPWQTWSSPWRGREALNSPPVASSWTLPLPKADRGKNQLREKRVGQRQLHRTWGQEKEGEAGKQEGCWTKIQGTKEGRAGEWESRGRKSAGVTVTAKDRAHPGRSGGRWSVTSEKQCSWPHVLPGRQGLTDQTSLTAHRGLGALATQSSKAQAQGSQGHNDL